MKVGIITHYYKSKNYGGNLQAYALCEFIKKEFKCDVEQISFDKKGDNKIKYFILKMMGYVKHYKTLLFVNKICKRHSMILKFNKKIKHSIPYSNSTIYKTNTKYDIFITGSDQVWNPIAVCPAYLLDFVNEDKIKLSYAASLAVNELSSKTKEMYKKSLNTYNAISVRENNSIELLKDITDKNIKCVLDPTLLLSRDEWDEVCEEYTIPDKYVFCYFLGDDMSHRKIAYQYCHKRNFKIVTFPHIHGIYRACDDSFGDYALYDVSPSHFLSLIKNAEAVITDSFHACVFSIIYKKEFFVFERRTKKSMGSRIYTLTELFDMKERYLDTEDKMSLNYIEKLNPIDYDKDFKEFEKVKMKSIEFLKANLESVNNED